MFDSVKFAVIFWINFVACSEESFDRNSAASVMPSELPCDVFFRELPENIQIDYIDSKPLIEFDKKGEKMMGVSDSYCDNAKINLHVDFDPKNQSVVENHTLCFANETFKAESSIYPLLTIMKLPERYVPIHKCMQTAIKYAERVPSMGMHRPLWARYGEYEYCPVQRWLHNVEHGAIVGLYHPCADPEEILQFKTLIKSCVYRHVITPYPKLTHERPIALVGWTASLEMPNFDFNLTKNFIKCFARTGPEHVFRDGQYNHLLVHPAKIVTNVIDSELCPGM